MILLHLSIRHNSCKSPMFYRSGSQRAGVYQKHAEKLSLFPAKHSFDFSLTPLFLSVHITEVQSRFITVSNGNIMPQRC